MALVHHQPLINPPQKRGYEGMFRRLCLTHIQHIEVSELNQYPNRYYCRRLYALSMLSYNIKITTTVHPVWHINPPYPIQTTALTITITTTTTTPPPTTTTTPGGIILRIYESIRLHASRHSPPSPQESAATDGILYGHACPVVQRQIIWFLTYGHSWLDLS